MTRILTGVSLAEDMIRSCSRSQSKILNSYHQSTSRISTTTSSSSSNSSSSNNSSSSSLRSTQNSTQRPSPIVPRTNTSTLRRSPRINRNKFFNDDKRFEDEDSHKLSDSEILLNRLKREFRPPKVLFENEKVIVIDKPSGCALQAEEASEPFYRWQLIYNHFESFNGSKLYLVHRLDKSTSGPLILAKSSTVARTISNQFQNSKILKKYLALVQFDRSKKGPIQDARGSGRIDCRVRNRNDRMVIAEAKREGSDCKRAITDWHIVTATSTHAIVGLRPKTGRKHQLRLHCSRFLSSPIVGDFKYDFEYLNDKSKKAIEGFLKRESSSRIMLHCSEIEFKLYRKIEPKEYTVNVRSEIPEDFRILCDQVDLSTESLRR